MSNTALGRTETAYLTNKSGGSVAQGDVVIVDTANASAFTTTTTSAYVSGRAGVVLEPNGIANNASGLVAFGGYVPSVNLSGTGSIGDMIKTHTVAKQGVRHTAPQVAGDFAQALATSATPAALLFGTVQLGAGSAGSPIYSKVDVMWHDQSIKTVGNAFATTIDAAEAYGFYTFQNTPANGDTWENGFICAAGTYGFKFLSYTDNNRGKLDVYIDASLIGTIDQYSSPAVKNQVLSITGIVLTDGYHKLQGVVNGKNASSSSYFIALTKIWLVPSAY